MFVRLLRLSIFKRLKRYIFSLFTGRIHSAVVSGLDLEMRSLTVEWYEKGETKGKEASKIHFISNTLDTGNNYYLI